MKKLYFFLFLMSSFAYSQDLELKGVIDFTVPEGGSDGKAIHLYAINDITDLSLYGIGVANNGGGTDGQEYTFPAIGATAGDHIFLPRSISAMTNYLESLDHFDIVIEASVATQNGDDAIELFFNGSVIETFGDVDCAPSSDGTTVTCPNYEYYENSWAYKETTTWTFAEALCTDDGSTTSSSSPCPYPFLDPNLSIGDTNEFKVSIFPNPANQLVHVNASVQGLKHIVLYDLNGRRVIESTTNNDTLDISQLNQGFYVLKVTIDNRSHTTKLIIQ